MIKINCDLCGKIEERLNKALIEGVELIVCYECSKFGKVIAPIRKSINKETIKAKLKAQEESEEKIELLVENYAELIKKAREALGLSQKDFAKTVNEKESTIHKIEIGALEPQLALAKKLEKVLKIKLIEDYHEKHESKKKGRIGGFTLGDFIKLSK